MKLKTLLVIVIAVILSWVPFILFAQAPEQSLPDAGKVNEWLTFKWLTAIPPIGQVFIAVLVLGYVMRRVNSVPNFLLPWLMIPGGAALFAYLSHVAGASNQSIASNAMLGLIVSTLAVLAVIAAHDKLLGAIAKKFPAVAFLVSEDVAEPVKPQQKEDK